MAAVIIASLISCAVTAIAAMLIVRLRRRSADGAIEVKDKLKKFENIIENGPVSVVITDKFGNIQYVNKKFCELSGYSRKDALEKNTRVLKSGMQNRNFYKDLWETINAGKVWRGEFHNIKGNGELYWETATISPVFDNDGLIEGFIAVKEDVTKRREAEEELEKRRKSLEHSLLSKIESIRKAQSLQQHLNTKILPLAEDYSCAALYMPCEDLGGDFFDIRKENGNFIVIIADCVGHGIESSMDATLLKSISDRHFPRLIDEGPSSFLREVNREVMRYFFDEKFPTMFVMVMDEQSKRIKYANANSEIPYIVNNGDLRRLPKPKGFHLGYDEGTVYESKSYILKENESLLLFSDALFEIQKDNELIPKEEILSLFKNLGYGTLKNIENLLDGLERIRSLPLEDDTTIIMIEHKQGAHDKYIINSLEEIEPILEDIKGLLTDYSFSEHNDIPFIVLAVSELMKNAVIHGNGSCEEKSVSLCLEVNAYRCKASIEDEGEGIDEEVLSRLVGQDAPDFDTVSNEKPKLGLWLCERYTDSLTFSKGTVEFERHKRFPKTEFRYSEDDHSVLLELREIAEDNENYFKWYKHINVFDLMEKVNDDVTIDFEDSNYLVSYEIGKLLAFADHLNKQNKSLSLRVYSSALHELLMNTNISKLENITIIDGNEEEVKA